LRASAGFKWQELDRSAFDQLEPAFGGRFGFGVALDDHGFISDPGEYVKALATHFTRSGGAYLQTEVTNLAVSGGSVTGMETLSGHHAFDDVVIATGAWSGPLAKMLGKKVPLESERGYHIELVNPSVMPKSPVMIASKKFVITPMDGRLRCAGIVEFGGLKAGPSQGPIRLLKRQIHEIFPGIRYDRIDEWMGHRPTLPDSVPMIGPFPDVKGAYAAFGHQHVGLTSGPKTGRMIANMISGGQSNLETEPYSVSRFG